MDTYTSQQQQQQSTATQPPSLLLPSNFVESIKNELSSGSASGDCKSIESDSCSSTSYMSSSGGETETSRRQETKLFVGNLPMSTTLPELLEVFKKYGPVNEALSVVKDQNYAFIHFYNKKDAEVAMREVNDSLFKDRYIRVQFSTSQGYATNKSRSQAERQRLLLEAQEKFHSNSSSFRPINSSSFSMYDLNQYAIDSRPDSVRPITGRNSQASSMSTSPSWQQFGSAAPCTNSSLLMPAMPAAFKRPAPIQKPCSSSKSSSIISLDAFQYQSAANQQQLLNYYYAQLQQQQQAQRQAALIQQQLQYQQKLQQQQRLLWEQRYSNMMAAAAAAAPHRSSGLMSRSATSDALTLQSATLSDYAMLSSLAAASSNSSNPSSHQLPRSSTLYTMRNNNI